MSSLEGTAQVKRLDSSPYCYFSFLPALQRHPMGSDELNDFDEIEF